MQCSGGYCRRGRGAAACLDRLVLHVKDPSDRRRDCVTTLCVECVQRHRVVCSTCGCKIVLYSTYTEPTCARASPIAHVDDNADDGADDSFLHYAWHEQDRVRAPTLLTAADDHAEAHVEAPQRTTTANV